MSLFSSIRASLERFGSSERGKKIMKAIRFLMGAAVLVVLALQLSDIGWASFFAELPRTPWFYVTIVVMYFTLPLFETGIYGAYWNASRAALFSVFVRKKVLNNDLPGYSGEVYLHFWAKEKLEGKNSRILRVIIDNNITSSLGGFSATGLLMGVLLLTGQIPLGRLIGPDYPVVIGSVILIGAVVSMAVYRFRHTIFGLGGREVLRMYGTHFVRFLVMFCLQIFQWWVVIPDAPFVAWATMWAVVTVGNRLPFIPARDLAAIAVILNLNLPISREAVAGLMVTRSVLDRVLNVGLFLPLSLSESAAGARTGQDVAEDSSELPPSEVTNPPAPDSRD